MSLDILGDMFSKKCQESNIYPVAISQSQIYKQRWGVSQKQYVGALNIASKF